MLTQTETPSATAGERLNLKYVWTISLVAALGGLMFGYDWVVVGGAKLFYEKFFHLTDPAQIGWAMSCALVGCLIGALAAGALSDKFGRRRLLIVSGFIFIYSSVALALTRDFNAFVLYRILGGIAIGLASNLSPVYIAEIAPAAMRGRLVAVNQLTIVIGVLLAQLVNWLIAQPMAPNATDQAILNSWNGQMGWRWMFGATAVPATFFFVLSFLIPESPRWLVKSGSDASALNVLEKIGGSTYASRSLGSIKDTLVNEIGKVCFRDLLQPKTARIVLIGATLAVLSQWSGINVILYYGQEVFTAAGYQVSSILFNIVITGAVLLVFTFVAIGNVDRKGRKILLLIGLAGLATIHSLIGWCFLVHSQGLHVLLLIMTAVALYAMSLAAMTWVVLSEIFPNRIRGAAMSIAVFALWAGSFALTYTFPLLEKGLGSAYTFWIYAAICAAGFVFVTRCIPETKGKTLEEIERELVD